MSGAMRVPAKLFIVAAMLATPAHAAVISTRPPALGATSCSFNQASRYIPATGTNFANGFHFDARQSSQSPPLGVLYNQVQYITGTYNFAGFDTLNFTVQKGQAGPGSHLLGAHVWQRCPNHGHGRRRHQRHRLPCRLSSATLSPVSNHPVSGFSEFAVDLTAVPAPATLPLVATGLGMMGWFA